MEKTKTEKNILKSIEYLKTVKAAEELLGFLILWSEEIKKDYLNQTE